jgi:hypothetical protein
VGRDLSFHADLIEDEGEIRVVLAGDIDLAAVPEFFARMQQADRAADCVVIAVMHDVTLMTRVDWVSWPALQQRVSSWS